MFSSESLPSKALPGASVEGSGEDAFVLPGSDVLSILCGSSRVSISNVVYWLLHWESCEVLTYDLSHPTVSRMVAENFAALADDGVNLGMFLKVLLAQLKTWRIKFASSPHVNLSLIHQVTITRLFLQFCGDTRDLQDVLRILKSGGTSSINAPGFAYASATEHAEVVSANQASLNNAEFHNEMVQLLGASTLDFGDDLLTALVMEMVDFLIEARPVQAELSNSGTHSSLQLHGEIFNLWFTLLNLGRRVDPSDDHVLGTVWKVCRQQGRQAALLQRLLLMFVEQRYLSSVYKERYQRTANEQNGLFSKVTNALSSLVLVPIKILSYWFSPANLYPLSDRAGMLLLYLVFSHFPNGLGKGVPADGHDFFAAFRVLNASLPSGADASVNVFFEDLTQTLMASLANCAGYPYTPRGTDKDKSAPSSQAGNQQRNEFALALLYAMLVHHPAFAAHFFFSAANKGLVSHLVNILVALLFQNPDFHTCPTHAIHRLLYVIHTRFSLHQGSSPVPVESSTLVHSLTYMPSESSVGSLIDKMISMAAFGFGGEGVVKQLTFDSTNTAEFVDHRMLVLMSLLHGVQWNLNVGNRLNKYRYGYYDHEECFSFQLAYERLGYALALAENILADHVAASAATSAPLSYPSLVRTQLLNLLRLHVDECTQLTLVAFAEQFKADATLAPADDDSVDLGEVSFLISLMSRVMRFASSALRLVDVREEVKAFTPLGDSLRTLTTKLRETAAHRTKRGDSSSTATEDLRLAQELDLLLAGGTPDASEWLSLSHHPHSVNPSASASNDEKFSSSASLFASVDVPFFRSFLRFEAVKLKLLPADGVTEEQAANDMPNTTMPYFNDGVEMEEDERRKARRDLADAILHSPAMEEIKSLH